MDTTQRIGENWCCILGAAVKPRNMIIVKYLKKDEKFTKWYTLRLLYLQATELSLLKFNLTFFNCNGTISEKKCFLIKRGKLLKLLVNVVKEALRAKKWIHFQSFIPFVPKCQKFRLHRKKHRNSENFEKNQNKRSEIFF